MSGEARIHTRWMNGGEPAGHRPATQGERNFQHRDCFPRLREGRLAALLAMAGIGAWPIFPSARKTEDKTSAAWIENPPYELIIPLFQRSIIPLTPAVNWGKGRIMQNKANLRRSR